MGAEAGPRLGVQGVQRAAHLLVAGIVADDVGVALHRVARGVDFQALAGLHAGGTGPHVPGPPLRVAHRQFPAGGAAGIGVLVGQPDLQPVRRRLPARQFH